jgi:hypothetical protein
LDNAKKAVQNSGKMTKDRFDVRQTISLERRPREPQPNVQVGQLSPFKKNEDDQAKDR